MKNNPIKKKKSTVSVDYTVDGKNATFKGTVVEGKRKAKMNVSNEKYGSVKSVEKFSKSGALKKQKFVDRDASGKLIKVTKNKVDKKTGNIYSRVTRSSK